VRKNKKAKQLVYRCMVFYFNEFPNNPRENRSAIVTKAYGITPERATIDEAYDDISRMQTTSMSRNTMASPFFPVVVEYIRGRKPPNKLFRQCYFFIDGN